MTPPTPLIDDYLLGTHVYSVMVDEAEGAYLAIEHLSSFGHERIALIRGDKSYTTNDYKERGYRQAFTDLSLQTDESLVIRTDAHEAGGYTAANALLDKPEPPTAIFTVNDQLAIGAIRAVNERGLRIPQDISIVGFSDLPISSHLYPPLTSVNQHSEKIGAIAAATILKVIRGKDLDQKRVLLQPALSIRQSTGPVSRP